MEKYRLITIGGHGGLAEGKRGAFFNMLEEYHKYWEQIDVICPRSNTNHQTPITKHFGNVYLHCSPWLKVFQPWFIARKLRQLVREQGADLIVVQEYAPFYNSLGLWLSGVKGIPVSYEVLHIVGYPRAGNGREGFYYWLSDRWLPRLLRRADLVRVMNQAVRTWLVRRGVPEDKIRLLPAFYLDQAVFRSQSQASPGPVGLGPKKKYDLVFCARLARNKGIFLLLDALVLLKKHFPDIKLLIIGDGPEKENARRKARSAKLDENIIFNGWAKDASAVAELLNQSKIFVMSSYNEGGPRTMIEAMACGLPVVATPVGLAPELIRDGENGFITDWRPVALAEKIHRLLADENLRRQFGQAGQTVSQKFERSTMIDNYASAYQQLIQTWKNK